MKQISYIEAKDSHLFIDVRSPSEYEQDHIPGAVCLPLFSDEERALVGTCYVQTGRQEAKRMAADIVAPKLPGMMDAFIAFQQENPYLACYCQKGGYRSRFVTSLFCSIDLYVSQLQGGYKEYRRIVREGLEAENEQITYIVLHGNTGVGKTDILQALKEMGKDIIDLEEVANHRGSLLGDIGRGRTHSQKWFESLLYKQMVSRKTNMVYIEAESDRIGSVIVPKPVMDRMKKGHHVRIDAGEKTRADILKKEYGSRHMWIQEAEAGITGIARHIGKGKFAEVKAALELGDFEQTAGLLMKYYYDPMYEHKNKEYVYQAVVENTGDAAAAARLLLARLPV